jgi:hypothetical protein
MYVTCNKRAIGAIGRLENFFCSDKSLSGGDKVTVFTNSCYALWLTSVAFKIGRLDEPPECETAEISGKLHTLFSEKEACDLGRLLPSYTKGSLGRMMWTLEAALVANRVA